MTTQDNVITVDAEWKKPFPNIDNDTREFWDGLTRHELLLWRCKSCSTWYWPKAFCNKCDNYGAFGSNMSWERSSGKGKIFSCNVHHMAFHPAFRDDIPYAYAVVQSEEGPLISAMLIDKIADPIASVGSPVEIVFEDHPKDGFTLPRFRLVDRKP